MRIFTTFTLLLTLFVTCVELHGQQDAEKAVPLKNGLSGFWKSESPSGESYVLLRKDGWFWALHKYSNSTISVAGGHWDTDRNKIILKRLLGDKAFDLVPEKRNLAFSIIGKDDFILGNWPVDGQKFKRCMDVPDNVGRIFKYQGYSNFIYKQYGILIPPEPEADTEIYSSVSQFNVLHHLYLGAGGKFRLTEGANSELSGTWKRSGDGLQLTGKDSGNTELVLELKKVDGQFKFIKAEANGQNIPTDKFPPPYQEFDDISLDAKKSTPEPTPEFFNELYQYIQGMTESEAIITRFEGEQESRETERLKGIFETDVNSGVISSYSKRINEAGVLQGWAKSRQSYNPFFGVHFSIVEVLPVASKPRTMYRMAITIKQDPITTRWSYPDMALAEGVEIFAEHVRLNKVNSRSEFIVTRDGKEVTKTTTKISRLGNEGFKMQWEKDKTEYEERLKKGGENEVEPKP